MLYDTISPLVHLKELMEMSKTKCPQLVETYHWMWEKYQNDHIMCSHLKIAFETEGVKVQEK